MLLEYQRRRKSIGSLLWLTLAIHFTIMRVIYLCKELAAAVSHSSEKCTSTVVVIDKYGAQGPSEALTTMLVLATEWFSSCFHFDPLCWRCILITLADDTIIYVPKSNISCFYSRGSHHVCP